MKLFNYKTNQFLNIGENFVYGGAYVVIDFNSENTSVKQTPFESIECETLKLLCEKTGATCYGDYVLLRAKAFKNYRGDTVKDQIDNVEKGNFYEDAILDGDVLRNMGNSGMCSSIFRGFYIVRTDDIEINKDYKFAQALYTKFQDKFNPTLNTKESIYKIDIDSIIKRTRSDKEFAYDNLLHLLQMNSAKCKKGLLQFIKQNDDAEIERLYYCNCARQGLYYYRNIFQEYSKYKIGEEKNQFEKIMEYINK